MQPQDRSLSISSDTTSQGTASEARTLVQELQSVLNRFLATGTGQAAQAINEVAVAAEQMGQQLRQDNQAGLADTVDGLAQQIRHFTTNMPAAGHPDDPARHRRGCQEAP